MKTLWMVAAALALGAGALAAQEPLSPDEFAWRGSLVLPQGASLARVELPLSLIHI